MYGSNVYVVLEGARASWAHPLAAQLATFWPWLCDVGVDAGVEISLLLLVCVYE